VHELGVAAEIYWQCLAHARGFGARLERVTVAIGELSAVDPELLRYAWEAAIAGGPDRGVALEIEWRPATQACTACGKKAPRQPGCWRLYCPSCGRALAVHGGRELDLIRISYAVPALAEERT
jgi:hydrogenase nickel incorporation protein HypA/HybF